MKISLGPIYFYWPKDKVFEFYEKIAQSDVDIVYLGEVICSKRKELNLDDWLTIANKLTAANKEVVLSTLTLLEADSELKRLNRICNTDNYLIEANDFAAINILSKQNKHFSIGPSVNIYNPQSLDFLNKKGLTRYCFPVELSKNSLQDTLLKQQDSSLQVEVFAFGKLPLAFSARCFTARHYNLDKDNCQYRCLDFADGMNLATKEDEDFLTINGIATMSAKTHNLIAQLDEMKKIGVDIVRISPQAFFTDKIIQIFKDRIDNKVSIDEATDKLNDFVVDSCDGYWHEQAGIQIQK